jgi:hypothetical protein
MAKRRVGVEYSPSMLKPVRPEAVSPDRALCLPTFSHFVIVNKTSLSLSLSLSIYQHQVLRRHTQCGSGCGSGVSWQNAGAGSWSWAFGVGRVIVDCTL